MPLAKPLRVISVCAGAAMFPQDGETVDELLATADRALYREKRPQLASAFADLLNAAGGYARVCL